MNEMVERVARAIHARYCDTAMGYVGAEKWENLADWEKDFGRGLARAAIESMREPTDNMFDAGEKAASVYSDRWMMSIADDVWRAMIDAALSDLT